MVKFQERKMKRRYKKKEHAYQKFLMEFPVRANPKIEPHKSKTFDELDITSKDLPKQEVLSIQLVRNKTPREINEQKPD